MMKRLTYIVILSLLLLSYVSGQIYPNGKNITMKEGEKINVEFTILNNDNESVFFYLKIPKVNDWELNANPDSGILMPHEAKIVNLTLKSPRVNTKNYWNFKIGVVEYNQTGVEKKFIFEINVKIISSGTFFFFFTLPLPESLGYWKKFINNAITWIIIAIIIYFIFPLLRRFTKWTKTEIDDILFAILQKPVTLWIILYGIVDSSFLLPISEDVASNIMETYNILVIIILTWIAYRIYKDLIIKYAFHISEKKGKMERTVISLFEKIGIVTIVTIGAIMIIQVFGIDITVILASMGVIGIILGFAAQDTLANFFSGIHILLDKSLKIDDYIMMENEEIVYKVKDVGLRSTKLYDIFAHTIIYIPNNIIANHKITNLSRPDTKLRLRIDVGVSYKSDVEKVKKTLRNIAKDNPHILKDEKHEPVIVFREFGESSLNFTVYLWVDKLTDQWLVASSIREKIVNSFRKEGIEIPYPQVDIHIRK